MLACPANTEARGSGSRPVSPRDFRDAAKIGTVKNKFECEKKKKGERNGGACDFECATREFTRIDSAGSLSLPLGCHRFYPLVSSATFVWLPLLRYLLGHYSRPLFATIVTSFFFRDFPPVTLLLLHVIPSRTAPTVYFRAAPMYRVSLL